MTMKTVTRQAKAADIRKGDVVTYLGQTFHAADVQTAPGGIVMVTVPGSYPQAIAVDRDVTIARYEQDRPYVVYTRLYDDNGHCEKRIHRFATAKAQAAFIGRTHRAVTYWNNG